MSRLYRGLVSGAVIAVMLAVGAAASGGGNAPATQVLELNKLTGDEPIQAILQELKHDPARAKKMVRAGLALAKDKKLQYNAAIILAQAASDLKDVPASEKFYRLCTDQAVKLSSTKKLLESFGGLIDLLYENKKYPEAARVCRELLELKMDDGKPREYYLAVERFGEVDFMPVDAFDAALPLQGGVHRLLIQAQAKQGKYEQALKLVDNLLKERDDWRDLQLKGWVLNEAGVFDEAAKVYQDVLDKIKQDKRLEARERNRHNFQNRYILSHVYVDLKQIDKATEHLEALLAQKPRGDPLLELRWIGLHNDLGYIWADNDMRLEEAEKLIRKALEMDREQRKGDPELEKQENGAYLDSLGWVLFKQRKYKEAKEYLLKAVEDKNAQHIEIYDHLGDVYMALGEREAALAAWRKGLELVGEGRREAERRAVVEKKLARYGK